MLIACAGERIHDETGKYLCTVAKDIPGDVKRLHSGLFTDCQVDLTDIEQRFPVTLWLVRRATGA